jgi:hypothetical protein
MPETGIFDATVSIRKVVREAMGSQWDNMPDEVEVVVERCDFVNNLYVSDQ